VKRTVGRLVLPKGSVLETDHPASRVGRRVTWLVGDRRTSRRFHPIVDPEVTRSKPLGSAPSPSLRTIHDCCATPTPPSASAPGWSGRLGSLRGHQDRDVLGRRSITLFRRCVVAAVVPDPVQRDVLEHVGRQLLLVHPEVPVAHWASPGISSPCPAKTENREGELELLTDPRGQRLDPSASLMLLLNIITLGFVEDAGRLRVQYGAAPDRSSVVEGRVELPVGGALVSETSPPALRLRPDPFFSGRPRSPAAREPLPSSLRCNVAFIDATPQSRQRAAGGEAASSPSGDCVRSGGSTASRRALTAQRARPRLPQTMSRPGDRRSGASFTSARAFSGGGTARVGIEG